MSGGDVVRVVAVWHAPAGAVEEVRRILRDLAAATRREDGCLGFEVLESTDQPGRFVLLEEYAGERGRQRHLGTDHFRDLVLGRAVPLLTYRDVQAYQPLWTDGGPGGARSACDNEEGPHHERP
ncbi:putative quinol monooxygenase [Planosporangium sp. 12N6]|uniref:putative quinol monooxygenase n=1 Tax=Planosporangium spinosum TaxID=3402278 RepID=UPI003CEACC4C